VGPERLKGLCAEQIFAQLAEERVSHCAHTQGAGPPRGAARRERRTARRRRERPNIPHRQYTNTRTNDGITGGLHVLRMTC